MATPFVSDQSSKNVERVCQTEAPHQEQSNVNLPRAAAEKRVVGFDCEFVERPAKAFQVDCPVCLLVLREPHQAICCGYSYCQLCIERVQFDKKPCPTCNTAEFSVFPNKGFQRSLYEFHVRCSHEKDGCQWTGELGELDKHLNESPILGRQFIGCEFAEVECNDCGKSFRRQHFRAHQLEQHPFSCEYCHDYESYYEDVVKNHWTVCGFYPVPCPNECGVYPERQNLEHHVSKDCPLTVVNCDFHYAGCEVHLIRQDMPAHLAENLVPHMAHLATYNQKKVQEKDQQIMQLTADLRQELEKNRRKIDRLEKENEALSTSLLEKKDEMVRLQEDLRTTADKITKLREDTRVKEEALKQEIAQLTKKNEDAVAKGDDALKEITRLQEHIRKKDEAMRHEIVELQQEQRESENKMIARLKTKEEKDETLQHEIAALKQRQEDAVSKEESEALKQEIAELRETSVSEEENEAVKQEVIQIGKKQKEYYETTKQELTHLKAKQEEDWSSLQTLQSYTTTPPVDFTMTEFAKHKRDGDNWYSEPLYTHPHGYKMCFNVYANGAGANKGTHVSIFFYLMRGKFDDYLKWPFLGDITVQVMNHLADKEHLEYTLSFSEASNIHTRRVITGERSTRGYGMCKFLSHSDLGHESAKNRQFLKDDCLHFRVTQVTNTSSDWTSLERQCLAIESRICVPPFEFTMRDFEQQKTNKDIWHSPSFYTHPQGYRMCLGVYANGNGDGKATHTSVFVYLMRGEWDNYLKWPFRGDITIHLFNQIEDKEHYEKTIHFTDNTPDDTAGRVMTGERALGWGWSRFISHDALNYNEAKNCQYLKYDCLHFKISEVELKN